MNRSQGINSASLCSMAGWYDNFILEVAIWERNRIGTKQEPIVSLRPHAIAALNYVERPSFPLEQRRQLVSIYVTRHVHCCARELPLPLSQQSSLGSHTVYILQNGIESLIACEISILCRSWNRLFNQYMCSSLFPMNHIQQCITKKFLKNERDLGE